MRKREIRRQLAAVCPVPLRAEELERAAALVERLAADREVVWLANRLDRADVEALLCRGEKA